MKLHEAAFSTGSALDAAAFRVLLDAMFHNCPSNAAGMMEPNAYAVEIWNVLSRHVYRDGKQGCSDARAALAKHFIETP